MILGWTAPGGSRVGIGALQVGYHDPGGRLQYAGAVGTGFDDEELEGAAPDASRAMATAEPPPGLMVAGDPIDTSTTWIRMELVAEVQYTVWSGAGRVRHAVYLGLREDKEAGEVVRELADPEAPRTRFRSNSCLHGSAAARKGWHGAVPASASATQAADAESPDP